MMFFSSKSVLLLLLLPPAWRADPAGLGGSLPTAGGVGVVPAHLLRGHPQVLGYARVRPAKGG